MRVLVVDGGGSKTRAVVFEDEKRIFEGFAGPSNPTVVGVDGALRSIEKALGNFKEFDVAVLGIAGVGFSKELRESIESDFKERFKVGKILILSDVHLCTVGSLGGKDGIVVIAGTGSVVVGYKEGEFHRVGGWGHILGDEGSGYRISLDSFRYALRYFEGRERRSILIDKLEERFGIESFEDVLRLIYVEKLEKNEIASFAPYLIEAVSEGDEIARKILTSNLEKLSEGVFYLSRKLDVSKVVGFGGLFDSEIYRETFERILSSGGLKLEKAVGTPIDGGLIVAKEVLR